MLEERVFFTAGDVVELKQEILYKPIMIVKSVDKITPTGERPVLLGILCFWFTEDGTYQEKRFNTKDLIRKE